MKIRPVDIIDEELLLKWSNDRALWEFILRNRFVNTIEHKEFFKKLCIDKSREYFILEEKKEALGLCGLREIDFINSKAELFVFIIKDVFRGRGFGEKALDFLIEYTFKTLSLNKLSLRVVEGNKALSLYKSKGFKVDGILRDEFKINHKYKNVYVMSLLYSEVTYE